MKKIILLLLPLTLQGCLVQNTDELQTWMDTEAQQISPNIPKLPPVAKFDPVEFTPTETMQNARNPFLAFAINNAVAEADPLLAAQEKRAKEYLEEFSLETLKVVGVLNKNKKPWLLVKTPDNTVHTISLGNHMGSSFGKLVKITDESFFLEELFQNSTGKWELQQNEYFFNKN